MTPLISCKCFNSALIPQVNTVASALELYIFINTVRSPYSSFYPSAHLIQGLITDPPAPDHPPLPPPTFSSSSWGHVAYAAEITPLGGGYLE